MSVFVPWHAWLRPIRKLLYKPVCMEGQTLVRIMSEAKQHLEGTSIVPRFEMEI